MRKYLLAACAIACLVGVPAPVSAGSFNGAGQFVGAVNPAVIAIMAAFPNGGPGLRAAIARMLEVNPALADDVVQAASKGSPAQKEAMGEGMADATLYFAKCGTDACRGFEGMIRWAMRFADEGTRIGIILGEAPTFAQGIPGFNNAGATTSGCVTSGNNNNNVVSQNAPPKLPGC
jgi:hypothetical protein